MAEINSTGAARSRKPKPLTKNQGGKVLGFVPRVIQGSRRAATEDECCDISKMFLSIQILASRAYSACYVGMYGEGLDVVEYVRSLNRCRGVDGPGDLPFLVDELNNELSHLNRSAKAMRGGAA